MASILARLTEHAAEVGFARRCERASVRFEWRASLRCGWVSSVLPTVERPEPPRTVSKSRSVHSPATVQCHILTIALGAIRVAELTQGTIAVTKSALQIGRQVGKRAGTRPPLDRAPVLAN
jgi:hypothetical protein